MSRYFFSTYKKTKHFLSLIYMIFFPKSRLTTSDPLVLPTSKISMQNFRFSFAFENSITVITSAHRYCSKPFHWDINGVYSDFQNENYALL